MTQSELAAAIARDAGLTPQQASAALVVALRTVQAALARGDSVALMGFGTFEVHAYPRKPGDKEWTGRRPAFRPGAALRRAVSAPE